jgi:hypothetical protein
MADRAPGAGSRCVSVIYNNMIVMTPMFVLFCVVVPQQMNRLPCLSKIPRLKVKQNPVSPYKAQRTDRYVPFVARCVRIYLVRSVSCCMWSLAAYPEGELCYEQNGSRTRQASVEYSCCCSDLYRVSFFAFQSTEYVSWFVCRTYRSVPYLHEDALVLYASW